MSNHITKHTLILLIFLFTILVGAACFCIYLGHHQWAVTYTCFYVLAYCTAIPRSARDLSDDTNSDIS